MPADNNNDLVPMTKENLPAMHEVPEIERYSYPDFDKYSFPNYEYVVEDNYKKASKARKMFIRFSFFLKELLMIFTIIFRKKYGFFKHLKSLCIETFHDITTDFTSRKSILKSTPFKRNCILSLIGIIVCSLLFALLATKTDSASEYMKTFFFTIMLCSVFLFFGNLMNPLHASSMLYSLLTSFLIITGVFLQVMFQKQENYTGVAGIIKNMGIGLVFGLIMCFTIIILCKTPYKKFARLIAISFTVILSLVVVILAILNRTTNGAANWINLFGSSIQITEIIKILSIIVMSMLFSRKDISQKKILFQNLIFLAFISLCFIICNELGTLFILGIAFLVLCFINLKSTGLLVKLGFLGCILLLLASWYGKTSYDKLYDVSDRVTVFVNAMYEKYSDNEKNYISYSQNNSSTLDIDFDDTTTAVRNKITLTFEKTDEKSAEELAEAAVEFFNGNAIDKKKYQIVESEIGKLEKNSDGSCQLVVEYKYEKDIPNVGLAAKLGGKIYRKALSRLGLEGDQTQAEQISAALHSIKWFGSEEKHIMNVSLMNSDTVFSFALMQLGAGGVILLLIIYMILFFTVLVCAYKSSDALTASLIIGFGVCISIQSVVQLCISLGLFPIMGMVSAFLSNGGTANLINYAMSFFILYAMRLVLPNKKAEDNKEVPQ